jgi:uncharacterized protein (DUF58 family)
MVRQQLAATASGTAIVLDVDATAYGSDERFGSAWDDQRFESAVEIAASLAASHVSGNDHVHLQTTASQATVASASSGATERLLDALAVVQAVLPSDAAPAEIVATVRRTRSAHTIVVTGTPGHRLVGAVQELARFIPTTVVCVGAAQAVQLRGVRVINVADASELVA